MDKIMEIVMIKMQGCMPCKIFEPTVKQYAEEKRIKFRTLQMEDMPKELHLLSLLLFKARKRYHSRMGWF